MNIRELEGKLEVLECGDLDSLKSIRQIAKRLGPRKIIIPNADHLLWKLVSSRFAYSPSNTETTALVTETREQRLATDCWLCSSAG